MGAHFVSLFSLDADPVADRDFDKKLKCANLPFQTLNRTKRPQMRYHIFILLVLFAIASGTRILFPPG
jgi:hypothetical protein